MKVYGFDDTGPHRGELLATIIDADELAFGWTIIAEDLGWRFAGMFTEARQKLLQEMKANNADPELIRGVRDSKARDVPEV